MTKQNAYIVSIKFSTDKVALGIQIYTHNIYVCIYTHTQTHTTNGQTNTDTYLDQIRIHRQTQTHTLTKLLRRATYRLYNPVNPPTFTNTA